MLARTWLQRPRKPFKVRGPGTDRAEIIFLSLGSENLSTKLPILYKVPVTRPLQVGIGKEQRNENTLVTTCIPCSFLCLYTTTCVAVPRLSPCGGAAAVCLSLRGPLKMRCTSSEAMVQRCNNMWLLGSGKDTSQEGELGKEKSK